MRWSWLVVLVFGGVSTAAAEPLVIRGKTYESWSAYYASPVFQAQPLRCGTADPVVGHGANGMAPRFGTLGSPADCAIDLTNPSDEYEPMQTLEIQVVVHRLESPLTGWGVFPDSLVQTQIDVLNEDYQAIAGSPGAPGKNIRIHFRLADRDPDGNPSPGWTRTTNEFWFNDQLDPLEGTYYDNLAWDPVHYLNIYTLSPDAPGGVVLGYVPFFPQEGGVGTNEDGVRCLWNAFGRVSANAPYDQGRTVTHEVGHYLGLFHTFQGGCTGAAAPACYNSGDCICDTEPEAASHGGCPVTSAECGDPDPIRNYMEYTNDACMNNFTHEQARRVRCTIEHYRPDLAQSTLLSVGSGARGQGLALAVAPQPMRSTGIVSFQLARPSAVRLAVVDVAGRVVRRIATDLLPAGAHRLAWDGADDGGTRVQAGTYFARIQTAEGHAATRLVLVR